MLSHPFARALAVTPRPAGALELVGWAFGFSVMGRGRVEETGSVGRDAALKVERMRFLNGCS